VFCNAYFLKFLLLARTRSSAYLLRMDVFAEFEQLAGALAAREIPYALIGGVAMAFHIQPRFTKDIDLLIQSPQLPLVTEALNSLGYFLSAGPWTFPHSQLTLHRFLKPVLDDEFVVDILVAESPEMAAIVDRAQPMKSQDHPIIRVARREDIILLKKQRASPLDQADITLLQDE